MSKVLVRTCVLAPVGPEEHNVALVYCGLVLDITQLDLAATHASDVDQFSPADHALW